MEKIGQRFLVLNGWVKAVFCFCLLGTLGNALVLMRDLENGGILWRLRLGFFILYAAQVIFILLRERFVGVLAVVQGLLALLTSSDFTFMPLTRVAGHLVYIFLPEMPIEYQSAVRYIMVSGAFTLQMLSAYILFSLLPKNTPVQSADTAACQN